MVSILDAGAPKLCFILICFFLKCFLQNITFMYFRSIQKNLLNWYEIGKSVELYCKPIDMVSTNKHFLLARLFIQTTYFVLTSHILTTYQFCLKYVFKVVQIYLKKDIRGDYKKLIFGAGGVEK